VLSFRRWLKRQVAALEADPTTAKAIAATARRKAAQLGLPAIVAKADVIDDPTEAGKVLAFLASAIGALADPQPSGPLTVAQAAARCGVSPSTIYGLCDSGELTCLRIGRSIRIDEKTLADFLGKGSKRAKPGQATLGQLLAV
jgi:excisionase family DNA binding protein